MAERVDMNMLLPHEMDIRSFIQSDAEFYGDPKNLGRTSWKSAIRKI